MCYKKILWTTMKFCERKGLKKILKYAQTTLRFCLGRLLQTHYLHSGRETKMSSGWLVHRIFHNG